MAARALGEKKYEVDGILRHRQMGKDEEFLVTWTGNYEPTWVIGSVLKKDAPALVEEFLKDPPCIKVLKGVIRPTSPTLNWGVVANLLALECTQAQWKPTGYSYKCKSKRFDVPFVESLVMYYKYVESSSNVAGKMPVLCDLLVKSVSLYKDLYRSSHNFRIIPVGKVYGEFRTDYMVGVVQMDPLGVRTLALFELKPSVPHTLANMPPPHLAQTLVQGYYALLGSDDIQSVVVALTDIDTTHYFKVKLSSRRSAKHPTAAPTCPKHLEMVWYKRVVLAEYPPSKAEHLFEFIEYFHAIIQEQL